MTPTKRAYEGDGPERKRSRRTRWEREEEPVRPSASPKALSDVVKKLSSVVKQQAVAQPLVVRDDATRARKALIPSLCSCLCVFVL